VLHRLPLRCRTARRCRQEVHQPWFREVCSVFIVQRIARQDRYIVHSKNPHSVDPWYQPGILAGSVFGEACGQNR
jgi:hypothetical protein